jgi:hypothetical protein
MIFYLSLDDATGHEYKDIDLLKSVLVVREVVPPRSPLYDLDLKYSI